MPTLKTPGLDALAEHVEAVDARWKDVADTVGDLDVQVERGEVAFEAWLAHLGTNGPGEPPVEPPYVPTPEPPVSGDAIVSFGFVSHLGGTDLPLAFGHLFHKGAVPNGQVVALDGVESQCTPITRWPDGSLRHAIIAARAEANAGEPARLDLLCREPQTSSMLTERELVLALPEVRLSAGPYDVLLNDLIGSAARHRVVVEGPIMSQWLYRLAVPLSDQVVVWFEVRLFSNGAVEIVPWVENGFLSVPNARNDLRHWTLTIDNAVRFDADLDIKHHTRAVLIDNRDSDVPYWSYWCGCEDPKVELLHDTRYLQDSGMVPNYGWPVAESASSRYLQTFRPGQVSDVSGNMGSSSHLHYVGHLPPWAAAWIASGGDLRAYRAVIKNGYESGAWTIHYRDENTNEPFKFSDYPRVWTSYGGAPMLRGLGGVYKDVKGVSVNPDLAHQPSYAWLPWVLTGRWFFLDEVLFWTTWSHADQNYQTREQDKGLLFQGQERGRDRVLRTLTHALVSVPDDHPLKPDLRTSFEANCIAHRDRYVRGTRDNGRWKNNLGWMGLYSSGGGSPYPNGAQGAGRYWWAASWMMMGFVGSWAHAWNADPDISDEAREALREVRDFGYRIPIGLAGPDEEGHWSYRHFATFQVPIGQDHSGIPPERWSEDYGESYRVAKTYVFDRWPAPPEIEGDTAIWYQNIGNNVELNHTHWGGHSAVIYGWSALVMAVEHGAPGAEEAWTRITGSASFEHAAAGFAREPAFGWWPRNKLRQVG